MDKLKKIVGWISIVAGVFFLFNIASDIQAGFGVMLIVQGVSMI